MSLMDWVPLAGAVLGGLSSKDKETKETTNSAPWAPAQPWITQNIANGQALQNAYMAQPFSQGQINAYGNSSALTDNFRSTANSLIPQITAQRQFDRTNPLGRATPYNYGNGSTGTVGSANSLGFTSQFGMNPVQQQQATQAYTSQGGGLAGGDTGFSPNDAFGGSTASGAANPGSAFGYSIGFDPSAAAKGILGGPLAALLAGITFTKDAQAAMNAGDYGRSSTEVGAPNAAQAAAIAADFANAMAAAGYGGNGSDGGLGDSGLGSAGNDGNDGAGGIGSW